MATQQEQQIAQLQKIIQAADQGNEQAVQYIQQVVSEDPNVIQPLTQIAQQMGANNVVAMLQNLTQSAKFGAKLNYIKRLNGICPEGYEMQLFKAGGRVCKKCMKKAKMEQGGTAPQSVVDAYKCGRKMKKKRAGGNIEPEEVDETDVPMFASKKRTLVDSKKCGGKQRKK